MRPAAPRRTVRRGGAHEERSGVGEHLRHPAEALAVLAALPDAQGGALRAQTHAGRRVESVEIFVVGLAEMAGALDAQDAAQLLPHRQRAAVDHLAGDEKLMMWVDEGDI